MAGYLVPGGTDMMRAMSVLPRTHAQRWLWLLAAVAVLRVAGFLFGPVNLDECDFALFGRLVREGATPYLGVVDNKPPLTYLAFALANLAGGSTHWVFSVHVLGIATVFLTSVALFAAARAWTGDERQGWAAAWLAVGAGLCESPSVSAELLMNLPAAAALYWLARAGRENRLWFDAAAGAAAAVATLFKQQAVVLPAAAMVSIAWEGLRGRERAWQRLACLACGFAVPWLVVAGVFDRLGGLPALCEWLLLRNLAQVGSPSPFSLARALGAVATCVLGATLLPWLLALRGARRPQGVFHRTLVVLLALTAIPVFMGGRFYEHYFLQFVPPLALLGAPQLVALRDRWPQLRPAARAALLALAAGPALGYLAYTLGRGWAGGYPGQDPKTAAVAGWLARHTARSDRVFVWGDQSMIYCSADRLPGTRYLRTAFHVGDLDPAHVAATAGFSPRLSQADVENTLADLEKTEPPIVVDTSTADIHHWSLFPLRTVPQLDRYVQAHYRLEATPAGAAVYRRLPANEDPHGRRVPGGESGHPKLPYAAAPIR